MAGGRCQWKCRHLSVPRPFVRAEAAPELSALRPGRRGGRGSAQGAQPAQLCRSRAARSLPPQRGAGEQLHSATLQVSCENRHWGF